MVAISNWLFVSNNYAVKPFLIKTDEGGKNTYLAIYEQFRPERFLMSHSFPASFSLSSFFQQFAVLYKILLTPRL